MKFFNWLCKKKALITPVKSLITPELPEIKPAKHLTGQIIFELNLTTLEIEPAKASVITGGVVEKPGFWYCAALNKKNAEKHFLKMANAK